jgi:AAA15 family ATPase/GTPase
MAINRVEIKNFLVFTGKFSADFCPGVNVIIGANGTGKTTLIKYLYWWSGNNKYLDWESNLDHQFKFTGIEHYFGGLQAKKNVDFNSWPKIISTKEVYDRIYIPEKEMLSHSTGLLALYNKRVIPFEKTYIDIVENAELPETKEISPLCQKLLDKIGNIIDGEVVYEQDAFYIKKKNGDRFHFSWEASGFRKFGLLWKLLRNGLLEKESLLFWDEPENSLNPELIPVLVDILLELTRNSVQVFLATHSEILASYFSINKQKDDRVMFYSLYKDENGIIKADKNDRFDLLDPNNLTAEPVKLYEIELEKGLGNG